MKIAKFVVCCLAVVMIFCGCGKKEDVMISDNSDGIYGTHIDEEYKKQIQNMKDEYAKTDENISADIAADMDMAVVFADGNVNKSYKIKNFCDSIIEKEPAAVRIAVFDKDKKNVIVKVLKYDTKKVYGYFDMRGYSYSSEDYLDFEYNHCELFEQETLNGEKINYMMYLTDSSDYTLEEIMNIVSDSEENEKQKCVYVCSYSD